MGRYYSKGPPPFGNFRQQQSFDSGVPRPFPIRVNVPFLLLIIIPERKDAPSSQRN
jgi:hypothetical protein